MSQNPKGDLIERCMREGLGKPEFRSRLIGPEHAPLFACDVYLAEKAIAHGEAKTKKRAERLAAEAALATLEASPEENTHQAAINAAPFEGPWPLVPEVLAASLHIANSRIDLKVKGEAGLEQVRQLALKLYKDVLEDLGEVLEVDETEPL